MPKSSRKRRRDGSLDQVVVASLEDSKNGDSIDSCIAEMSGGSGIVSRTAPFYTAKTNDASMIGKGSELLDTVVDAPYKWSNQEIERITAWNRSMHFWQKCGTYSAGLLPSFDIELARHFKVQALSSFLLEECKELKMPAFERWLIDSKLEEKSQGIASSTDPVLSNVDLSFRSCQRLLEEARETGMDRNTSKKLVKNLCLKTNTAIQELRVLVPLHAGRNPLKKGDRIDLEGHAPVYTLVYHRKKWNKPFCIKINSTHYEKLKEMFLRVHGQVGQSVVFSEAGRTTKTIHAFHLLSMVLLVRYSSLSGGQLLLDLRGGGMQGAVHGQLFCVLRRFFPDGPLLESFGSPLNAYLRNFCSAFPSDLDWHFGSFGSFLEETMVEGCCEANPPFSPGMMTAMAEKIDSDLEKADKNGKSLTFVVVVPNAGDDNDIQRAAAKRFGGIALKRMTSSSRCRRHVILLAKEHGYIEGAQHMRPTRYKGSLYDTSVVILQNLKARSLKLDLEAFEREIRDAFKSRHMEEIEGRKQIQSDVQKQKPMI